MKTVIISPFSKTLRNGLNNAKNYPWWNEVIQLLKQIPCHVIQIGRTGEDEIGADEFLKDLSLKELKELVLKCDAFISSDNFMPHFCNLLDKSGIVIFSKSDPKIFGYRNNINLYKDEKYFRKSQFDVWEAVPYDIDAFVDPERVYKEAIYLLGLTHQSKIERGDQLTERA